MGIGGIEGIVLLGQIAANATAHAPRHFAYHVADDALVVPLPCHRALIAAKIVDTAIWMLAEFLDVHSQHFWEVLGLVESLYCGEACWYAVLLLHVHILRRSFLHIQHLITEGFHCFQWHQVEQSM